MTARIILVGPPRAGKSTYARELRARGIPTYCTDPLSLVKDPEKGVHYLPEGLSWNDASKYVVDEWFPMPGPWCIDGVATVRAIRKLFAYGKGSLLHGVRIVRFTKQHERAVTKNGQRAMAKGIDTVWLEIEPDVAHQTEYR